MGDYKISVIIPIYKAENFLQMCVDSILRQTFKEFEIVLVDDGSPDRSGQICDKYAAQHQNIIVIHQENAGINKARYAGVKKATSDWITFVDNDDTLPIDALERLYAQTEGTELVIGSFTDLDVKEGLSLEAYRQGVIDSTLIPPQPWGKLYRKELFSESTFDFPREIDGAEDMIMSIRILFSLNRPPHFVKKSVYNFLRRTSSASHTIKKTLDYEYLFDDCRVNSIPKEQREKYMQNVLRNRINGLIGVAINFSKDVAKKQHPFFDRIDEDIKQYHYKTNIREKLLLHSHSPLMMKGIAYQRMISLSLKYRLHLLFSKLNKK
ncbi:glycosyltransferase [Hoylesella saccharolytica]|uniref:glycosyltransferase family 2 protein n=1 Tax=Hoylesella saccharolytica TaxID=633701 RepID=UPI0028E9FDE6|nr:glycosyltransferase [Hoylesella saccharolytica]